jgi:uncharacterized protein (DUF1810 family)
MADTYDLQRFVEAQGGVVWESALAELIAGHKQSHWMWFVFPQARGLGRSAMAWRYGIASLDEARAYLAHPLLGPRLDRGADAVLHSGQPSLNAIFGSPDDMKFISAMSLFRLAEGEARQGLWQAALDRWNGGQLDPRTVELIAG